ncbi:MAG: hypothetical protein IJ949_07800, partial [Oscillospiraceae bacterium]|nr:hypothetical protein [Oscillospiraceae bacterium]
MKKILSFILALTLCIGLLPTFAFAATAEEFVVDFTQVDSEKLTISSNKYYFKTDSSAAERVENGNGVAWSILKEASAAVTSKDVVRFFPAGTDAANDNHGLLLNLWPGNITGGTNWVTVEFNVPNSGIYDVVIDSYKDSSAGYGIISIDNTHSSEEINFNLATGSFVENIPVVSEVYLSKGNHQIKILATKAGVKNGATYGACIPVKNITFTPSSGAVLYDFTNDGAGATLENPWADYPQYLYYNNGTAYADGWEAIGKLSSISKGKQVRFRTDYLWLNATPSNGRDTIVFNLTVPETSVYDIAITAAYWKENGVMDMYIGNKFIASGMDFYDGDAESQDAYEIVSVAKGIYLTEGVHQYKIVCKNSPVSVADGTAYAQARIKNLIFTPSSETVIAPDAQELKVSFAETTNIAGFDGINVSSVARGASVELTAHKQDIDGYKFVGWKRGADTSDDNAWVDITGDTYNVWTNTYLTAVYEPVAAPAEKVVEFWNQNGAYLGKATEATYATVVKKVPTLTGFATFLGWFTDGNVELDENTVLSVGTTNAVAQYEANTVSGVMLNGNIVDDADAYNKEIPLTMSAGSTCWKRDGKIISYDANYIYNVWGATAITEGTDAIADKVPVAIFEYSSAYGAYMLEYDDGDYEIVEAGIIFDGDSVDSCAKKYTSQRKVSHNQFTAPKG